MRIETPNPAGREEEKIFIASISAIFFDPRVVTEEMKPWGTFVCRLRKGVGPAEEMVINLAHRPLLFLWLTEDAARQSAMRTAKEFLPEEAGFTNHAVVLTEISRATFVEAQIFMSLRESFRWLLRLTGFSKS